MLTGSNINYGKLEAQNMRIQNLSSAPGSPVTGQVYYDTTLNQFGCYQLATWVYLAVAGSGDMVLNLAQTVTGAKTFGTIGGAVGKFILAGSTSGSTILNANAVAGAGTVVLPTTGTLATLAGAEVLTNKDLTTLNTFPTFNQNTTGSAATLTTSRNIYGNAFNGSADVTGIIAATYGGTNNAFTQFSGPAASIKTFTLPNASDTLAGLAQANVWTGVQQFGTIGGAVGKFTLAGSTSGFTTVNAPAVAAAGVLTLPAGTDTLVGKATTDILTNKDLTSGTNTFPTFNQNTTGSAATWTTARLLAGNSVNGSANVAFANKFIVQGTVDTGLSAAQFLGALGTGLVKNTTTTGVLSIAVAGTDYSTASATEVFTNKTFDAAGTGNVLSNISTSMFAANVVDTDGTLTANSTTRIPSQSAVVTYVNSNIQGVRWKAPVRASTVVAGTLASSFANTSVIDGVTLATGDRILIKDQAAGQENGIYTVNAAGAPTRAVDADTATEVLQFVVSTSEGTANGDKSFVNTTNAPITLGTTPLVITDFVTSNVPIATTAVAGKVFLATLAEAEAKTDTTKAVVSADLANYGLTKTATIGDNVSTSLAVTDNLTINKVAICRDATTGAEILVDKTYAANTTTFIFAVAPATNAYKVVIIGI